MTVRVGIIGAGNLGATHARDLMGISVRRSSASPMCCPPMARRWRARSSGAISRKTQRSSWQLLKVSHLSST